MRYSQLAVLLTCLIKSYSSPLWLQQIWTPQATMVCQISRFKSCHYKKVESFIYYNILCIYIYLALFDSSSRSFSLSLSLYLGPVGCHCEACVWGLGDVDDLQAAHFLECSAGIGRRGYQSNLLVLLGEPWALDGRCLSTFFAQAFWCCRQHIRVTAHVLPTDKYMYDKDG
jgi:hypothetical protein